MAKPVTLPTWATDANLSSGTESGSSTKLEPSAGVKAQGFVPGAAAPARHYNWLLNLIYEWVAYLNGLATDAQFLGTVWSWTNRHIWSGSFGPGLRDSDSCEVVYCGAAGAASTRTRVVRVLPIAARVDTNGWADTTLAAGEPQRLGFPIDSTTRVAFFDLSAYVPSGGTVTGLRALVTQGDATGTMTLGHTAVTVNFSSPAQSRSNTTLDSAAGGGIQILDSGVISLAIDKASNTQRAAYVANADNGGISDLHCLEITFTDPGPRNY